MGGQHIDSCGKEKEGRALDEKEWRRDDTTQMVSHQHELLQWKIRNMIEEGDKARRHRHRLVLGNTRPCHFMNTDIIQQQH